LPAAFRFDSSRPLKHLSNFRPIFAALGYGRAALSGEVENRPTAEDVNANGDCAKSARDRGFTRDRLEGAKVGEGRWDTRERGD
jgi:hypothetical protein